METAPLTAGQEVVCALAGPLGSLLLVGLVRWCPMVAFCGLVQGSFNLLPLYPMDGGRVLNGLLTLGCCEHREQILEIVEWIVLLILLWAAISMGWMGIFTWGLLAMRKIPCKATGFGVQ